MRDYPMAFSDFTRRFSTERQCRAYLCRLRWPDGFVCPKCGGTEGAWPVGAKLHTCRKCRRQTSVIAGTVFQDTRKPMKEWFTAIWWVTTQKNGASAMGLRRVLGLKSYTTAWTWLQKIRKAMVFPDRTRLCGTVEVDECHIGGGQSGGMRGRGAGGKSIVAVGVEVKEGKSRLGRARMAVVPDVSAGSLVETFVKGNVEPGARVVTDGWHGYCPLGAGGYPREVPDKFKEPDPGNPLPHVHLIVSLLKRWLLGTHQGAVGGVHLQAYLDEFVFRFNRRKSADRGLLFQRLLECAMRTEPVTQDELLGHKKKSC